MFGFNSFIPTLPIIYCPQNAPLVYHYGHTSPGHNNVLYKELVSRLADVVRERMKVHVTEHSNDEGGRL